MLQCVAQPAAGYRLRWGLRSAGAGGGQGAVRRARPPGTAFERVVTPLAFLEFLSQPSAMAHPLLPDLLRLPPDQRLELAMALWDSIEEAPEAATAFPLTAELRAELDRRVAEHQADPASAISWENIERQFLRGA